MVSAKTRLKGKVKDLFWRFYGPTLQNPEFPPNPASFLFVCKGNICRSPFAEKLAEKMASNWRLNGLIFRSAGLKVDEPKPCPKTAIEAAKSFDIDLSQHRSKPITHELIESASVILVMEAHQYRTIRKEYPKHCRKVQLFPIITDDPIECNQRFLKYNILDPYNRDYQTYLNCYHRLRSLIEMMLNVSNESAMGSSYCFD